MMGWDRTDPANRADLPHERRDRELEREDRLDEYTPVARCAYAGEGGCSPFVRWHHPVQKQRIKSQFKHGALWDEALLRWTPASRYDPVTFTDNHGRTLSDILGDTRNQVFLCDTHHERLHNARFELELPRSVYEFAAEYGFTAQLENDLARRAA